MLNSDNTTLNEKTYGEWEECLCITFDVLEDNIMIMAYRNEKLFKFKSKKTHAKMGTSKNQLSDCEVETIHKPPESVQCLKRDDETSRACSIENKKQTTLIQCFSKKRKNEVVDIIHVPEADCTKEKDSETVSEIEICDKLSQPKRKKQIDIVEISSSSQSSTEELMRKISTNFEEEFLMKDSNLQIDETLKKKLLHQQKCDDIKFESGLTVFVRRKSQSFINFLEHFCKNRPFVAIDIPQLIRQVPPQKEIKSKYLIITDTSFDYDKNTLALNILKFGLDNELYIIHIEDLMANDLPKILNDWKFECKQIMSEFEYKIENKLYYLTIVKDEISGLGFFNPLSRNQVYDIFTKLVEEEEEFMGLYPKISGVDQEKLKELLDTYHEIFCYIVEVLFDINDVLFQVHDNLFY
ncbi:DgyrCDS14601 [Dimorphilus gyrociliatus]|uniref:DgyrCDS14601 n=1 Tax=Dimorphilus gyrociliatus TaxID=2664684 RepID=A0A7I8WE45_9ANNE|nr:DgyrCDS14601 [Dimorphilus gyrociliatus]